jgi:hypothetical protein
MPFKKGDIIIKAEAVYPHGALVVDGYDYQGQLLAYPEGGGFQYAFKAGADRQLRHVTPDERQGPLWKTSQFCLEGVDGAFKGWTNGHLWNGWERPHFELEEAQKLVAAINDPKVRYDSAKDVFITTNGDAEDEVWPAQLITALGPNHVKVYSIGTGAWCWEEVSNEKP